MTPRCFLIFILLQCDFFFCSSHHQHRALYPVTHRVRRGRAALGNPVFQKSIKDVHLLYEILHAGLDFPDTHGSFRVHDEELASLPRARTLEVICEELLPKNLSEIRRLIAALSQSIGGATLRREDFERTLLTMVYAAQRATRAASCHQGSLWAGSLVELYRVIERDLTAK